jgi:hypothetical protein
MVLLQADQRHLGPPQAGHRRTEDPDGTGAEHDDPVAGLDVAVDRHRAVGDAGRLGEGGALEGEVGGKAVQDAGGNRHPRTHRAVHGGPVAPPTRIELIEARSGQRAVGVDDGVGLAGHPVPGSEAPHPATHLADRAAELVAEDNGVADRPALERLPLVDVAAAHAHGRHLEEDLVLARRGHRHLAHLHRPGLRTVVDDRRLVHAASPVRLEWYQRVRALAPGRGSDTQRTFSC